MSTTASASLSGDKLDQAYSGPQRRRAGEVNSCLGFAAAERPVLHLGFAKKTIHSTSRTSPYRVTTKNPHSTHCPRPGLDEDVGMVCGMEAVTLGYMSLVPGCRVFQCLLDRDAGTSRAPSGSTADLQCPSAVYIRHRPKGAAFRQLLTPVRPKPDGEHDSKASEPEAI